MGSVTRLFETPVPSDALLFPGQTVPVARERGVTVKVAAVVPAGFSIDNAIADQAIPQDFRPGEIPKERIYDETVYVLEYSDDLELAIFGHTDLLAWIAKFRKGKGGNKCKTK